jgi:plastocyanin
MRLMRGNVAGWMMAVIVLIAATTAHACPKCGSGPNGECGPDCTCCGGGHASAPDAPLPTAPDPEPGVVDVLMLDFQFVPEDITVTPGTTVRWTNEDFDAHDTISDDALWHSEYLANGQSFEYTFTDDRIQQLSYYCSIHGGMTGSVTVVVPEPSTFSLLLLLSMIHRGRPLRSLPGQRSKPPKAKGMRSSNLPRSGSGSVRPI